MHQCHDRRSRLAHAWRQAAPYIGLALAGATLYGVFTGAGDAHREYHCIGVRGGQLPPGADEFIRDLSPAEITPAPGGGFVIRTTNLGVLTAEACHAGGHRH